MDETTTLVIDAGFNFLFCFNFIKNCITNIVNYLDHVYLLGDMSILDLSMALVVFALILPLVLNLVKGSLNEKISGNSD